MLVTANAEGLLTLRKEGEPVTDPDQLRPEYRDLVRRVVNNLAQSELLVR